MLTLEQRKNLKPGDKLIFVESSGVLIGDPGDVVTFARCMTFEEVKKRSPITPNHWAPDYCECRIIQIQEELDLGNYEHNFSYKSFELFDPEKHIYFHMLTANEISDKEQDFIAKYGGYATRPSEGQI